MKLNSFAQIELKLRVRAVIVKLDVAQNINFLTTFFAFLRQPLKAGSARQHLEA